MQAPAPRLLLVAMLLHALPALAQSPSFSDDFETGTLATTDTPPGKWSAVFNQATSKVAAAAAAAHRGSYGLRLTDTSAASAIDGSEATAQYQLTPVQGSYYARYWLRVTSSNGASDQLWTLELNGTGGGNDDLDDVVVNAVAAPPVFSLAGYDSTGAYPWHDTNVGYGTGVWHLVETSLTGIGSTAGVRKLWIDGVLAATTTGLSLTAPQPAIDQLHVGEPWSLNHTFAGALDFDDVRSDTVPLASHLDLGTVNGGAPLTGCTKVELSLRDSVTGALAAAPYAFGAAVAVQGISGRFYADPGCTTPVTSAPFAAGATTATVYLWPESVGAGALTAAYVDFLPAQASVVSQSQGGILAVGCTCSSTSAAPVPWALLLGLALVKKRGHRRPITLAFR